ALPLLAGRIVVHEDHPVELAEVVDGDDAEDEAVARDGGQPALEPDGVQHLALVPPGGLPGTVLHLGDVDVVGWLPARLAGTRRDELGRVLLPRKPQRHEAMVAPGGVDVGPEVLVRGPVAVWLLVSHPDVGSAEAARAAAHEVQRLAIRSDPRLLVDRVDGVDAVGKALRRRPVPSRARPLALADAAGDEDVGSLALNPLVA